MRLNLLHALLATPLILLAGGADAPPLVTGRVELVASGLTTDPLVFDGAWDVYHVVVQNDDRPGTTADFELPGPLINDIDLVTFLDLDTNPLVFGLTPAYDYPSTFFNVPMQRGGASTLDLLSILYEDSNSVLSAEYTLLGDTPVIYLGEQVVAVLSVPAGVVPDTSQYFGRFIADSESVPIVFVPEPTTATLLSCLALAAFRRRTDRVCNN